MDENVSYISRKQRQKNIDEILNSLDPDKHNFNTMILGFTDIMQSTFYHSLVKLCKSQKERTALTDRINKCVNEVMEVLNEHSLSNPEDMVVLNTVMIEAINKALIRQDKDSESKVNPSFTKTR